MDSLAERFKHVSIAIVGDVMLDRYWWGTVERISPEAPVPVVKLERSTLVLGGAANVAANVASLGAKAILLGCCGDDEEGDLLFERLSDSSIESDYLSRSANRPTPVKTRIVAHSQHVVRVDRENVEAVDGRTEDDLIKKATDVIAEVDLIIVSDYAKGTLTTSLLTSLMQSANNAGKKVVVDPKGKDFAKYKGATVMTPNKREALDACGLEIHEKQALQIAGKRLMSDLGLEALVITEGDKGMTLFERDRQPVNLKAEAREIYDVTGAGDTVTACLGVSLAAGFSFADSVQIANTAASLVVDQVGTTVISLDRLQAALQGRQEEPASEVSSTST